MPENASVDVERESFTLDFRSYVDCLCAIEGFCVDAVVDFPDEIVASRFVVHKVFIDFLCDDMRGKIVNDIVVGFAKFNVCLGNCFTY